MAEDSYERASGLLKPSGFHRVLVGPSNSIAEGERKIVEADGHSIGVFHLADRWYALSNSCLHRGGPVCTGTLEGTTLTCPWHGYQYDIRTGELLLDHTSCLPTYKVLLREGQVYVEVPVYAAEEQEPSLGTLFKTASARTTEALPNKCVSRRRPKARAPHAGCRRRRGCGGVQRRRSLLCDAERCTHAEGPLNEGDIEGSQVTCPWHASVFDVRDGSVVVGPAADPLKTYTVVVEGEIGRVSA